MTLNHDQKNLPKIIPSAGSTYQNIRQFYIIFPNCDALRHELNWTHYRLLPRIEKEELEKEKQFLELKFKEKRNFNKLLEGKK